MVKDAQDAGSTRAVDLGERRQPALAQPAQARLAADVQRIVGGDGQTVQEVAVRAVGLGEQALLVAAQFHEAAVGGKIQRAVGQLGDAPHRRRRLKGSEVVGREPRARPHRGAGRRAHPEPPLPVAVDGHDGRRRQPVGDGVGRERAAIVPAQTAESAEPDVAVRILVDGDGLVLGQPLLHGVMVDEETRSLGRGGGGRQKQGSQRPAEPDAERVRHRHSPRAVRARHTLTISAASMAAVSRSRNSPPASTVRRSSRRERVCG